MKAEQIQHIIEAEFEDVAAKRAGEALIALGVTSENVLTAKMPALSDVHKNAIVNYMRNKEVRVKI